MKTLTKHITTAGCLTLLAGLGIQDVQAQPTILLTDDFERTTGSAVGGGGNFSDWGANDNAQGGSIVQTYIHTPSRPDGDGGVDQTVQEGDSGEFDGDADNEGVIRFGVTMVDYDLASDANVLAGGGYTVDFNFRRPSGFLTFYFGYDPVDAGTVSSGAAFGPVTSLFGAEHVHLFQDDGLGGGRVQVFESGTKLDPPGDINGAFGISTEQQAAKITVLAPDGFDAGDVITTSLEINGNTIALAEHAVTTDGAHPGYVGWSSNSGGALIDDLVITALGTASGLVGDLDGDGFVGINDLNIVLGAWNQNVPPADPAADPSGDGFVGIDDLNEVLGNWNAGTPPPPGAAVPEPASLALMGLGAAAVLRRKR